MFGRFFNSLSFKLVTISLIAQITTLFIVTYHIFKTNDAYQESEYHGAVITNFLDFYEINIAIDALFANDRSSTRFVKRGETTQKNWKHVLDNNPDLWYFVQSSNVNSSYGKVPEHLWSEQELNKSKSQAQQNYVRSNEFCRVISESGEKEARIYSSYFIECGINKQLKWALGGVSEDYKPMHAWIKASKLASEKDAD